MSLSPFLLLLLLLALVVSCCAHQQPGDDTTTFTKPDVNENSNPVGGLSNALTVVKTRVAVAREFLTAHNEIRSRFQVPPLKWDRKLARQARRWANLRAATDCDVHNHSGSGYGENQFWGFLDHWTPTKAVQNWASEYDFYDIKSNQCNPNQKCGHFTQIVWRTTERIGCARVECKCSKGGWFVVCEYDPPGNYISSGPLDGGN
ncbi:pathogenesis-related protein 1C-like [Tripterygium wilfordii]|uniref:pathogenesis-related protein 1C-like n=1 Tax=Tripterygium wilfordii TaxID=458696 RepID=UPI0018F84C3A|nr:pathogenesis-related protein 1C-like [Tripterygium wilfordii]